MNLSRAAAVQVARAVSATAATLKGAEVWIAPPFPYLSVVAEEISRTALPSSEFRPRLGAQHVHYEPEGAFTGEVAASQLKDIGCDFVIVGHSERRQFFGETSTLASRRTLAALSQGLSVIFCIGESLGERQAGHTNEVLAGQLEPLVQLLKEHPACLKAAVKLPALLIAYEPVWAIGTGRSASLSDIKEAHAHIARWWEQHNAAPLPPILYGGSVSPDNFAEILKVPLVSGALVGKASLDAEKFNQLSRLAASNQP
jgi:triosephosphate isomerase